MPGFANTAQQSEPKDEMQVKPEDEAKDNT